MSLPLSATIHIEDGTVVVEYTKATSYYTKTGGDPVWQSNNAYGIKGTETDVNLTAGNIGNISIGNNSYQVWATENMSGSAQTQNVGTYITFFNQTSNVTVNDLLSDFNPRTNSNLNTNQLLNNLSVALGTGITLSTKLETIADLDFDFSITAQQIFNSFDPQSDFSNYYSRGLITHVLGMNFSAPYDPMNPTGLAQFQWDWSNPIDATVATCLATAAFTATAGFGLEVGVILRTGGLTPYFFGAAGTTATVTLPIYEPEIESTIPKVQNIILNGIDSLPNTLNKTSLVQFQNAIAQNAPNFSQLTVSQQNLLIYQKLAIQTQGLTTQINIMLRVMNNDGTINYSNEFAPKLLNLYYQWFNSREAYQQAIFNLSNSNEPTIH